MNVLTWIAIGVLGPGALLVFIAFTRDVRGLLQKPGDDRDA
jgi:hypothetical protein